MNPVKIRNLEIGKGRPKIILPIVGAVKEEILEQARQIRTLPADLVEWRVDWYEHADQWSEIETTLKALRRILGEMPILFTFRTAAEGGERAIDAEAYRTLNLQAVESGLVDLVDVELFSADRMVEEIARAAHQAGVAVIASSHDFHHTPEDREIIRRLRAMDEQGADLLKIAVMPENMQDVLTLLSATQRMQALSSRPVVSMAMGKLGVISRLAGEAFGSALTFGSAGKASAPGQVDVRQLHEILNSLHTVLDGRK